MTVGSQTPAIADLLDEANALEASGRALDAIDLLDAADRALWHGALERRLVELRHSAFGELQATASVTPWPEVAPFEAPLRDGLPVVPIEDLTASVLRSGILEHGCVRVPGAVPRPRCERLAEDIERGFAAVTAHDAAGSSAPTAWYAPFPHTADVSTGPSLSVQRKRAANAGSLWSVDSPRLLQEVCVLTEEVGLRALIKDYIGERPVMSARKSNLRRVPIDAFLADWHQDGAFLGKGIRTLNVWITLSDCGVDAPGLDIVPKRLHDVVETGTEGTIFDWAVSPQKVAEVAGAAIVRPVFEAGEALLFDELFLHRTACEPGMTTQRYALENWYFAPSDYPSRQIPLVY